MYIICICICRCICTCISICICICICICNMYMYMYILIYTLYMCLFIHCINIVSIASWLAEPGGHRLSQQSVSLLSQSWRVAWQSGGSKNDLIHFNTIHGRIQYDLIHLNEFMWFLNGGLEDRWCSQLDFFQHGTVDRTDAGNFMKFPCFPWDCARAAWRGGENPSENSRSCDGFHGVV